MKKILFVIGFSILLFTGCSKTDDRQIFSEKSTVFNARTAASEAYTYKMKTDTRLLKVLAEKSGNLNKNTFVYSNVVNGITLFTLNYSFDTTNEGWKYKEQKKAIDFSVALQSYHLNKTELDELLYLIDTASYDLHKDVVDNGYDTELFYTLSYLRAAVAANMRALNSNTAIIKGSISPAFLVGKTNFTFMEDIKVDLVQLKNNISTIDQQSNYVAADNNVSLFIKNTSKTETTFDELYNFYIPNQQYISIINNIVYNAGDCAETCKIGCGSDWGCCGNYTGCCWMSSKLCYLHDMGCITCMNPFICGWLCVPEKPGVPNRQVAYFSIGPQ